ncbi:hypothetical protein [Streptomyces sp. NPDC060194]|uniref:hypothetical protein n=1 Tax=Streptomyces sp. NPDC060194 TaxID=3347069 RepID=UPI00364F5313
MAVEEPPVEGAVRLNAAREVERYDGQTWRPYRQVSDEDPFNRSLFRGGSGQPGDPAAGGGAGADGAGQEDRK